MKKILLSFGMAVLTGVLLLGATAAFGLDEPTQTPTTAGLVGPTFSDATIEGGLDVSGYITDSTDSEVSIGVGNVFKVLGNIIGTTATFTGKVNSTGLNVSGDSTVTGTVKIGTGTKPLLSQAPPSGSTPTDRGVLRVQTNGGYIEIGPQNTSWSHLITDRARFYLNKTLFVGGGIIGAYSTNLQLRTSSGGNTWFTIYHAADAAAGIGAGDVKIAKNVEAGGNITTVGGNISTTDGNVGTINGIVAGKAGAFTAGVLAGTLGATGNIVSSTGNIVATAGTLGGRNLIIESNADIRGAVYNGSYGKPLHVNDDMSVSGSITATKIGKYTKRSSAWKAVPSATTDVHSKACEANEILVDCTYTTSHSNQTSKTTAFRLVELYTGNVFGVGDICYVRARNTNGTGTTSNRHIKAHALCFDSRL